MFIDFPEKEKTLRTVLYDDQQFSLWEMEILHTPIVQRLYDLKQLGFSDRVFPDAVHSRFNHILGVAEVARQMVENLIKWLKKNKDEEFSFFEKGKPGPISGPQLAVRVEEREGAVRLIALLHDLTHAAFGHTLEDEVRVFKEKHDNPRRQAIFLNALTFQLVGTWKGEIVPNGSCPVADLIAFSRMEGGVTKARNKALEFAKAIKKYNPKSAKKLAKFLRELEFASKALLHLEWAHGSKKLKAATSPKLIVTEICEALDPKSKSLAFTPHLDLFLLDLIGNTICADLLDYAKRDATNAGLKYGFDIRLIKYVCAVSVNGELSPDNKPCIRLATQFFTDKMRYDVLSEMSAILKARYLINERILFHPVKCAFGAVLGTVVQFLGLTNPPVWVQALGDQAFLSLLDQMAHYLTKAADNISERGTLDFQQVAEDLLPVDPRQAKLLVGLLKNLCPSSRGSTITGVAFAATLRLRVEAAQKLLWRLKAQRIPELVYRLRLDAQTDDGETTKIIAQKFSELHKRFSVERKVEKICGLPKGTVIIHCPPEKPGVKIAEALVVGSNLSNARHLRNVSRSSNDRFHKELQPYEAEIRAIEDMYTSIWHLHAFLDPDFTYKASIVEKVLHDQLGAPIDGLMKKIKPENEKNCYDFVADNFKVKYGNEVLPKIMQKLDKPESAIYRNRKKNRNQSELAMDAINKANQEANQEASVPSVPGLGDL